MAMKNSSDIIGNRTRDILACSAVAQPTGPPRAPRPTMYLMEKNVLEIAPGGGKYLADDTTN